MKSKWNFAARVLLPACLLCVSCKTSEDAAATASQMTITATQLGDYYEGLAKVVDTHEKLERLQQAMLGVPVSEQDIAQLQSVHDEIVKREATAHALAHLAEDLTHLSGSTAPADVSTAASSLGTELSDIQQLPGSSYAPSVLPPAAKFLTQLSLEHSERKIAQDIEPTMNALSEMFEHERPAYESINKTCIVLAQSLANELVQRNQVDTAGLMAPALQPFGLSGRMPAGQLPQGLQEYAHGEIQRRGQDEIAAQQKATSSMIDALQEMTKRVHQLATDGRMPARGLPFTLSEIHAWTRQLP